MTSALLDTAEDAKNTYLTAVNSEHDPGLGGSAAVRPPPWRREFSRQREMRADVFAPVGQLH